MNPQTHPTDRSGLRAYYTNRVWSRVPTCRSQGELEQACNHSSRLGGRARQPWATERLRPKPYLQANARAATSASSDGPGCSSGTHSQVWRCYTVYLFNGLEALSANLSVGSRNRHDTTRQGTPPTPSQHGIRGPVVNASKQRLLADLESVEKAHHGGGCATAGSL
jgi:hypothetical protein